MAPDEEGQGAPAAVRWYPLVAASVLLATVVFCLATTGDATWSSHTAYWVVLMVAGIGSVAVAGWALRSTGGGRRTWPRVWLSRLGLLAATLFGAAALLYLRPVGADAAAIDALADGRGVDVKATTLVVRMQPSHPKPTGLVFYPGAKIDPRAYAGILRPIAEAGYPVVIIKLPFNIAALSPSAADVVVGDDDDTVRWVVGGHSLGGEMAAAYAAEEHDELAGLLLYAAFPADSIADRTGLAVTSVYGMADGVTTAGDVERAKDDLPADTTFVPIEGGIHAFFGDYGPQVGDGSATVSRNDAQSQIIDATLDLMRQVDERG